MELKEFSLSFSDGRPAGEKRPLADALRFGDSRYENGNIAGLADDKGSSVDKKGSSADKKGSSANKKVFCGR